MKKLLCLLVSLAMLTGCAAGPTETTGPVETTAPAADGEVLIRLSDEGVEFPGDSGVHVANDIIYYEAGHGEDYGEGEAWEAHTPEEAAAHTVVHITRPGVYRLTGLLSLGQIAVDLGENAKDDPTAAVVLILDNAEIYAAMGTELIGISKSEVTNSNFIENPADNLQEVAEALGVHENTLSRRLRTELPQEEQERILAIINELGKEEG